jgi:hypothetical protein
MLDTNIKKFALLCMSEFGYGDLNIHIEKQIESVSYIRTTGKLSKYTLKKLVIKLMPTEQHKFALEAINKGASLTFVKSRLDPSKNLEIESYGDRLHRQNSYAWALLVAEIRHDLHLSKALTMKKVNNRLGCIEPA